MNNDQQTIVHLLCSSIRGEKVNNNNICNVNWKIIFQMAREQDIYTLLYPVVKNFRDDMQPENEIMHEWKKRTILASLNQTQNINKMSLVLNTFNKNEIPVIALKGLILREFYPIKEFRTMSDSDILIHIEDLEKVQKILSNMGYFEDHRDLKHAVFLHKQYLPIEIHWLLVDTNYFSNASYLEKDIWKNTETIDICGTTVLIPSKENQVLYLCLHMAVHFVYSGFGLRQLSDLVLFVETNRNKMNWSSFYQKIEKCKIQNFVIAIFEVCRRLFGMIVPYELYNKELENNEYINMIIYNVFSRGVYGGVFGKSNLYLMDENSLTYHKNNDQCNHFTEKLKYILMFFFPKPYRFTERYNYARKYPIFIPIAWIHRILYGIVRNDLNNDEKRNIFLQLQSDFWIKRVNLFKWLGL